MFSVIIPVYNGEACIENAIKCVLSQTFTKWELIIVDDGSTDGTPKILEKYSENDKIKIITQPNGGVSSARNTAMKNASYDYFAFLDCDDFWASNHLETFSKMIEKYPDGGIFTTLTEIRAVDGSSITNKSYFDKHGCKSDSDIIYLENFMAEYDNDKSVKGHMSCVCFSRKAAEKAGEFSTGCKIGEDLAFYLTAAAYYPAVLSNAATAVYDRPNSTATKDVSFDPDWFFFDEVGKIFADNTVSDDTKTHLKSIMQWFTMRRARHYAIDGKRSKAWKSFKEIGKNKKLFKDKLITFAILLMPTFLVKRIFIIRWRTQG